MSENIKACYFHVEDNEFYAKSINRLLVAYGYERIELATTAKDAQIQAEAGLYAAAHFGLIDYNLPDGDGIRVTKMLKELGVSAYLIAHNMSDMNYGDETIPKDTPIETFLSRLDALFSPTTS